MQFTIGRLMIVVVIAAVLSAWLRIPNAVALTVAALVMLGPPLIAFLFLVIPMVWLMVYAVLCSDPVGAVVWFMD